MRRVKQLFLIAVLGLMVMNCKKNDNEDTNKPINAEPEATPVGTFIEEAGSGVIGSEGGTVISSDGKLELEFPAGSLNSSTNITIQTITNNSPGGVGNAFRFGPAGTQLNTPVTLKFHYTNEDVNGSLPMFLGMAVQDTDGIWYNLGRPTIDTINKTITIKSKKLFPAASSRSTRGIAASNFLDHATFLDLYIKPEASEMKISESGVFTVYAIELHDASETVQGDEDVLPPLPTQHEVPGIVKQWTLNGSRSPSAEFGTISPNDSKCTYKAPSSKPSRNPVNLTADIKLWYKDPETGKDFNNLKITAPITIIEDQKKYLLEIYYYDDKWPAYFIWTLTDKASMDVEVTNGIVSIKNIKNTNGSVDPTTQTKVVINGVESCTSNLQGSPKSTGMLNITSGSGQVRMNDLDPNSPWLDLIVISSNMVTPRFSYECTREETVYMGGDTLVTQQYSMHFVLTDEVQNFGSPGDLALAKLTPKPSQ